MGRRARLPRRRTASAGLQVARAAGAEALRPPKLSSVEAGCRMVSLRRGRRHAKTRRRRRRSAAAEQSASQAFEIHWFIKPVSSHLCALQDFIQQQAVQTHLCLQDQRSST